MEILIKCHTKDHLNLNELTEFQGELKQLSDDRYQKLKKQILELGFSAPFFVWRHEGKNFLCDGHQRARTLKVMEQEGAFIPPLPVVFIDAKDKKEAKKKVLAFTSQYGQMTEQGLSDFAIDAGLNLTDITDNFNFPEINLDKFNIGDGGEYDAQCDEDEVPEVVEPRAKLGEHRLMCGDSTNAESVALLMNGEKADMVFTDPPYGIGYVGGSKKRTEIENDARDDEFGPFLDRVFATAKTALSLGSPIYACSPVGLEAGEFFRAWKKIGWHYQSCLVWKKNNASFTRFDYHTKHEFIHYGWQDGAAHTWEGDRKQDTVWEFDRPSKSDLHPTMKPVELIEYALGNSSKREAKVLDLFGGSGSTLIACEKTNRKCYMMELDPHYCDVIIERWQKFSGKIAEKVSGKRVDNA